MMIWGYSDSVGHLMHVLDQIDGSGNMNWGLGFDNDGLGFGYTVMVSVI